MAFRVLVVGGRGFRNYARLRDALDRYLVNRVPDVELVTGGRPGVPALAASYARPRSLPVTAVLPEQVKHPGDARERRDGQLVALAAAVIVWEEGHGDMPRLFSLARARGTPLAVPGAPARPVAPPDAVVTPPRRRLPD